MKTSNISSLKLLLLISGIILISSEKGFSQWSTSGNSISGTNFLGTTNNEPLIFKTNNHQSMVILADGDVGIGTTDPHYALQVVGDIVDSGTLYADNIETANSITVGQFRIVNGIIDSIVSTSGTLQLSATVVNADGALTAAQTLTAGTSSPAITIDGDIGTITSPSGKVGFGSDTIVTTAMVKAGSFQANYFKADSIYTSQIIPHDSILYLGDPYAFLNTHYVMSNVQLNNFSCTCPKTFYSNPNTGFSFVNSGTSNCPVYLTVGGNIPDAELNVTGPCSFPTGNLLFSATNNTSQSDVFTIDKSGNTYAAGTFAVNTATVPAGYSMAVNGAVIATDVYVELYGSWPDYVFDKQYQRRDLEELETYLSINHHLPGLPSAQEIKDKGSFSIEQIVTQDTKQIEELTLDVIELNKKINELEEQNKELIEVLKQKK